MRNLDVGTLPVCEGERLVGMITDRDITIRATAQGQDPRTTPVRDAMTPEVVCCIESDEVKSVARLMQDAQLRRLLVVNAGGRLVGIISLGDLALQTGDDKLAGRPWRECPSPLGSGSEGAERGGHVHDRSSRARQVKRESGKSLRRRTLERLLRSHGAQLAAWRQILREELPAMVAGARDVVEDGMDHVARAVGVAVVEASSSTVRGIESALRRLKRGRYGACEDCGGRIHSARLRVLPFALRCRDCQQEYEGPGSAAMAAPSF
jgi:RNA polymerase-binding transcription factor DksA